MNMKAAEMLKLEIIERVPGEVRMRVPRWGGEYFLYLDLTGKGRHHCTCRDFSPFASARRWRETFCRHIVAAMLKENRPEMLLPFLCLKTKAGDMRL